MHTLLLRHVPAVLLLALAAGCAAPPRMTRDEAIAATSRTYAKGIAPEDVLRAAEEVFRLADGDDFTFHHTQDSLSATRNWLLYLIIGATTGTDHWAVKAQPGPDGTTRATVQLGTVSQDILPMAVSPALWIPGVMPASANPPLGRAVYDLFWDRVDYQLGLRETWVDCKQADARLAANRALGDNSSLCNSFNIADKPPTKRVAAQRP
jgi:hypothetical protein